MALPTRQQEKHDYQTCDDDDCPRYPCQVYKEGFRAGHVVGWHRGYATGYSEGYQKGYGDGYAAGAASASKG